MRVVELGTLNYRAAWAAQEAAHAQVCDGGDERFLLVEHPPTITYGRRPGVDRNLLATPDQLAAMNVEIVQSDRGGDITFHGPGQLVVYPIIRLADHRLSVSGYVHLLEKTVVSYLATLNVVATVDPAAVGVWTPNPAGIPAKICAIGVRIRRGVTMHGLALNVSTGLNFFDLIIPCGLLARPVTSLLEILGDDAPSLATVGTALVNLLTARLPAVVKPVQIPDVVG